MRPNCNRCDIGATCRGAANAQKMAACGRFLAPYDKWKVAELAIAYPTSLNECLSALPDKFETNIDIYLEGRKNGRN